MTVKALRGTIQIQEINPFLTVPSCLVQLQKEQQQLTDFAGR